MIDHLTIPTKQFDKEAAFYEAALAPLGYSKAARFPDTQQFKSERDSIWISGIPASDPTPTPRHTAFLAPNAEAVKAFYEAAMAAGGTDNGAPGPRKNYGPGYYAAFVRDPDGNNIEAVVRDYHD